MDNQCSFGDIMKRIASLLGIILLLCSCGKEADRLTLSTSSDKCDIDAAGDVTITVQAVSFVDYNVQKRMEKYEELHPNVHFEILDQIEWGVKDIGLSKVYSDITQGKGPDIIIAWREDMSNLIEKGCLLDISGALTEDTKKAVLNSALDYGNIDGKIYLAPSALNTSIMIVPKSVINGDSWTIADLIAVIEEREKEGSPYEWIALTDSIPCQAADVLDLFTRCMDSSGFIDWNERTCSFDDPLFVKVLEISKRYNDYAGMNPPSVSNFGEAAEIVKQGKALALYTGTSSLQSYSDEKERLGPDYKWIGFPCDDGSGKRATYATNMAVNRNTEYALIIKDFINMFYSFDFCAMSLDEIRTDIYNGRIAYSDFYNSYGVQYAGYDDQDFFWPLKVKPDGSFYVDEYFDFLQSFEAIELDRYNAYLAIEDIVYEEAELFFSGDKTAEEVAKLIQSRVQLMLNE